MKRFLPTLAVPAALPAAPADAQDRTIASAASSDDLIGLVIDLTIRPTTRGARNAMFKRFDRQRNASPAQAAIAG